MARRLRRAISPVVIGTAGIPAYWVRQLATKDYPYDPVEAWALAGAGAVTGVAGFVRRRDVPSLIGAVGGVAAPGVVWWYLNVYSEFTPRADDLEVGQPFPDFALTASDGDTVTRSDLAGRRTVVMCIRGGWCPFCTTELLAARAEHQRLVDRGLRVLVVSVDSPAQNAALRTRVGLDADFVSDEHGALLGALGLADERGLPPGFGRTGFGSAELGRTTYLPTTFLLDEHGVIRWIYRPANYRTRASIADVLHAADDVFGLDLRDQVTVEV